MNRWHSLLVDAINNRQTLLIRYDDWIADRVIEPHAYGVNDKGNETLHAWQVAGTSESGERTGWKMFTVTKIVSIRPTGDHFANARPGYRRNATTMQRIYAQV